MQIFAGYAENAIQPLAKTYLPCAQEVDAGCGAGFVATDVQVGSVSAPNDAAGLMPTASVPVVLAALMAFWIGLC